jgi:hypothetical protein
VFQVFMDVFDLKKLSPVLIAKGIMLDQFPIGKNGQLLIEKDCFLGTYSAEVIYFGIEKRGQRTDNGYRPKLKRKEGNCYKFYFYPKIQNKN